MTVNPATMASGLDEKAGIENTSPPCHNGEMPLSAKLRGAIFDLGGVMTEPLFRNRPDLDPRYANLAAFFLAEFHDVYHLPTGAHDLHQLEIGAISDDEFFERMCRRYTEAGHPSVDVREAEEAIFGPGMVECGAMIDAVRQVKGGGYRTALLTNISRTGESIWRSLLPIEELFDTVVDSSQVGLRKPDVRIFELTCRRLGLAPSECLFVDDLQCNIDAAASMGMTTIHCPDPVSVADEVVQLLLGHPATEEVRA